MLSLRCRVTCATPLLQSIELATLGKLEEHSYDLRFSMHLFALPSTLWDVILYITNAPYDEMVNSLNVHNFSGELKNLLLKCKMEFSKKIENTLEDVVEIEQVIGRQVQRKMNPSDVLEPDTLIIYPTKETNNEVSLINLSKNQNLSS